MKRILLAIVAVVFLNSVVTLGPAVGDESQLRGQAVAALRKHGAKVTETGTPDQQITRIFFGCLYLRSMTMNKTEVVKLLKAHQDDRGIQNWKKLGEKTGGLKSLGIGLTQLRKLAKQIGRDHKLAQQLWKSDIYDVKIIGLLIDDPKQISREQAEQQVEDLQAGLLTHVFASCDATLAKTPMAFEVACDWIESEDAIRRRCGYSLLYELSKKNPKGMDDDFLLARIEHIESAIHDEEMWVRESMNTALMGIGKRNKKLNKAAVRAAKAIGPVDIDYGEGNSCEPLDVLKHLTSDYLKQKLGV